MARPQALAELVVHDYVLPSNRDDPEDEQVKWRVRGLEAHERMAVLGLIVDGVHFTKDEKGDTTIDLNKTDKAAMLKSFRSGVVYGLQGWRNFLKPEVDEDTGQLTGKMVPCEFPGEGEEAVSKLDPGIIMELGTYILAASRLTGAEEGN